VAVTTRCNHAPGRPCSRPGAASADNLPFPVFSPRCGHNSPGNHMVALSRMPGTVCGSEFFRDVPERIVRLAVITRLLPSTIYDNPCLLELQPGEIFVSRLRCRGEAANSNCATDPVHRHPITCHPAFSACRSNRTCWHEIFSSSRPSPR